MLGLVVRPVDANLIVHDDKHRCAGTHGVLELDVETTPSTNDHKEVSALRLEGCHLIRVEICGLEWEAAGHLLCRVRNN